MSTDAPGLVRVTVASGTRRVDLALPAAVPVAEVLPGLARRVGLLDATTVHGGYHVVTQDGRRLSGAAGLAAQGVVDGGLLTVAAGVDAEPPRRYDDVVEAMADVVERELRSWEPAAGRRAALAAAVLLLGLGAGALLLREDGWVAGVTAAVVAALLLSGAVVLSRVQDEPEAAVAAAWVGAGYAAVAGLLLAPGPGPLSDAALLGPSVAAAGGGLVTGGVVALVGLGRGRVLLLPSVVVGAVVLAGGLATDAAPLRLAPVLTAALVVAVVAGSIVPRLALAATPTRVDPVATTAEPTAEPAEVDRERVRADARVAHELLLAVTATVGVLLVLVGPLASSLGLAGTALAVACCVVVLLRTRECRTRPQVRAGLLSGLLGLVAVAAAVLVLHPGWRSATAVVLAVGGVLLLTGTVLPPVSSVRRARWGDVVESAALLALLPLLAVATGLVAAAGG